MNALLKDAGTSALPSLAEIEAAALEDGYVLRELRQVVAPQSPVVAECAAHRLDLVGIVANAVRR